MNMTVGLFNVGMVVNVRLSNVWLRNTLMRLGKSDESLSEPHLFLFLDR